MQNFDGGKIGTYTQNSIINMNSCTLMYNEKMIEGQNGSLRTNSVIILTNTMFSQLDTIHFFDVTTIYN